MKIIHASNRRQAFTKLELLIIAVILGLFAALLLPALRKSKARSGPPCYAHLQQVGQAFQIWAGDHGGQFPMQYQQDSIWAPKPDGTNSLVRCLQVMSNELSTPKMLLCPNDHERTAATNFTSDFNSTHISYFLGWDAVPVEKHLSMSEDRMLLAGDRNMTGGIRVGGSVLVSATDQQVGWSAPMHRNTGMILFADGSVRNLSTPELRQALANTGTNVNRLLFP